MLLKHGVIPETLGVTIDTNAVKPKTVHITYAAAMDLGLTPIELLGSWYMETEDPGFDIGHAIIQDLHRAGCRRRGNSAYTYPDIIRWKNRSQPIPADVHWYLTYIWACKANTSNVKGEPPTFAAHLYRKMFLSKIREKVSTLTGQPQHQRPRRRYSEGWKAPEPRK